VSEARHTRWCTAADAPLVPENLGTNEIVINEWLAEDLQIGPGAELQLRYYVIGGGQRLDERTNTFRVNAVVPLMGVRGDRALMPEFPGIAKAESTENWDAGFPIEMGRNSAEDEAYWKQHRGTPEGVHQPRRGTGAVGKSIREHHSHSLSLHKQRQRTGRANSSPRSNPPCWVCPSNPFANKALAASTSGQDFGQLFLGFSFFLILRRAHPDGLMFQFGLEQRVTEIGTLLAAGFPAETSAANFLWERRCCSH
jgi:hypothetical protein